MSKPKSGVIKIKGLVRYVDDRFSDWSFQRSLWCLENSRIEALNYDKFEKLKADITEFKKGSTKTGSTREPHGVNANAEKEIRKFLSVAMGENGAEVNPDLSDTWVLVNFDVEIEDPKKVLIHLVYDAIQESDDPDCENTTEKTVDL